MPGFLKRYPDAGLAQEALRRSGALRAQGVATPAAQPAAAENELVFERIDGASGRDLIDADPGPLLDVLADLHRATVPGLPCHDPMRRIRSRLAMSEAALLRRVVEGPFPRGTSTLHGDLHVGQLIRQPSGAVWIIDLDDMALGPPEADLANFAAHLATTEPGADIGTWAVRVCRAWNRPGRKIDGRIFARFLELALLRRHLKLREAGRPDFEAEILAYLRESASFSIR